MIRTATQLKAKVRNLSGGDILVFTLTVKCAADIPPFCDQPKEQGSALYRRK